MIDPAKVAAILRRLNEQEGEGAHSWVEAEGLHSLLATEVRGNSLAPVPNSAVGVKLFANTVTGEIRVYLASVLDADIRTLPKGRTSTTEVNPADQAAN